MTGNSQVGPVLWDFVVVLPKSESANKMQNENIRRKEKGVELSFYNVAFFVELHGWGDRDFAKFPIHIAVMFREKGYKVLKIKLALIRTYYIILFLNIFY